MTPLRGSCIQPKKQLKVQNIGILEEIDSFYWPKMHLWKGDKKFGQGPLPISFGQNPKEQQFFLWNPPLLWWEHLTLGSVINMLSIYQSMFEVFFQFCEFMLRCRMVLSLWGLKKWRLLSNTEIGQIMKKVCRENFSYIERPQPAILPSHMTREKQFWNILQPWIIMFNWASA